MSLKIGGIIDDRYRITARIGHGGMSEVYEAMDIISRKTVAIKLIREDVMSNPINFRRFQNEATIAASLKHDNIVKVYNHGTTEGRPYIVNEYINGQTLKDVLDFNTKMSLQEAMSVMVQLTAALEYAHSHGIIHRDIKPHNLYMLTDGSIKLGDFGIAESESSLLNHRNDKDIVGSVHYLAPEISRGNPASAQSDIYAAGITFFELITGHVPFDGDDSVNVAVAHIRDRFPSPRKYLPDCPKEIEKIIFKATNKNLNQRYKTAAEFHEDLVRVQSNPEVMKEKKSFFARLFGFK
ncbi:MAG: protein kinase [Bacilli bacterium]|nr:protein kinase [Bacilli bacterium]